MSDNVPSQSALAKLSDKIRNKLEPKTAAPANGKKAGKKGNNGKKDAAKKETPKKEAAKKDTSKNDNKLKPKKDFKKDAKAAKPAGNNKDDKSVLLREIKAFGGDEKDLDLVGDSDGEGSVMDFGDDTADKKAKPLNKKDLDNDVFKFMNEIGLKGDGTSNVDVVMDDHDDAEVPDLVEEKPKSKKDKKAETKKEKVDKKADKSDKKEKSDKSDKLNKKEKVDERKTQFNQSTSNDIDQIMNEMTIIESTDSVFNASHSKYKLILTPRSEWYNHELPEPKALDIPTSSVLTERLYEKAKNLLVKENELFTHENNKSNSQKQFLSQLLTAGTLSDKIGAYSLLIQESPLHSVKYLTSLLSLCRKKSRGSALQSIAALKDIFVQGNVLPDRKLRWFKNQPGLSSFTSPELLIVWAFEDWLKQYFFSLIQILEVLSHDTVPYVRSNAVLHIFDLLKSKPEQEANLLRLGVNKLGDSDKKVASRVSYLLLQVQQAHPAMKNIIVNSISELLFRPGSDYHSRYYSVITLNQTIIAHKEIDVANTLMKTYLSLFERLLAEWNNEKPVPEAEVKKVKKPRWKNKGNKGKHGGERVMAKTSEAVKEDETNKLTSAILTGMNRAYPFSELPEDLLLSHINTLYRVTHSANFNTSVQALILLFQISKKDQGLSDRFYKTLYESLLDPRLSVSSKLRLYLNLLFKAIKQDVNIERVKAFAKRLVQIADHWLNVGVVAGVLYLLIELSKSTPRLREVIFSTGGAKQLENGEEKAEEVYDGKKRDPIFANAGKTKLWELLPLLNHFHPTVELYANSLVGKPQLGENGKPMKLGQPDMSLHGLSHFLDRFVYRNPKQKTVTHGSSIMQPLAGSDATGLVLGADRSRNMKPVNINDWAKVKIENVDVGERFFYNYFMAKNKRDGAAPKKKDGAKSGDFDEDGLNEDAVWKALVSSKPDVEADDDDDLSMSDFSDLEDDDEEDVDLEDDDEEDVDLEDDEEEADADEDKPAAADDESDDNMGLDDEEGLLDSEEEISLGGDDGDEDDDAALEAMFEKELEKAGNKRALDSDDEDAEVSDAAEKPQEKPAKKKSKKQKLKDLPVFASAEDYAQFLGSSDDEDYS